MKENIHDYCKVGIVHFMMWKDCIKGDGDHGSVDVILNDPFFDAIELTRINDAGTRRNVASKIKASGKAVGFGAQPVLLTQKLDLNHLDEAERQKAVAGVLAVVPQAVELGARGFALLSGKNVAPDRKSEAFEQLLKSLHEIAGALRKHAGPPLILETFDQLPYGKNCLIGSNADAAVIAREMRKKFPEFGLMIDLSHLPLQGETPQQAWDAVAPYLVHAHIGNCVMEKPGHPMNGDEHPPLADPDGRNGLPELVEYLQTLLKGGFLNKKTRPFLSLEVCVYGNLTREAAIQQSKDIVQAAWERA